MNMQFAYSQFFPQKKTVKNDKERRMKYAAAFGGTKTDSERMQSLSFGQEKIIFDTLID